MNHRDYCSYKSYKCYSECEFIVLMHASTTNESERERTQQYQRKPNKKHRCGQEALRWRTLYVYTRAMIIIQNKIYVYTIH